MLYFYIVWLTLLPLIVTLLYRLVDIVAPQAMIFCHTRKTVNWLVEKMTAEGHAVALLSGELTVEERLVVLDR